MAVDAFQSDEGTERETSIVTSGGDSGVSVSAKENPCGDKGYLKKSPSDSDRQQWRRRDASGTFCRRIGRLGICDVATVLKRREMRGNPWFPRLPSRTRKAAVRELAREH